MTNQWAGMPPTNCDICKTPISEVFIDGKTDQGPWGCLCEKCHAEHGVGLGEGKGQKYQKQGDKYLKITG